AACPACAHDARKMVQLGDRLREHPVPDPGLPSGAEAVAWILRREESRTAGARSVWGKSPYRLVPAVVLVALVLGAALVARPLLFKRDSARPEPGLSARAKAAMTLVIVDDERLGRQVLLAPWALDARESRDARVR